MPTSKVESKLASAVTIGIAYVQVSETDNLMFSTLLHSTRFHKVGLHRKDSTLIWIVQAFGEKK